MGDIKVEVEYIKLRNMGMTNRQVLILIELRRRYLKGEFNK